MARLTTRSFLHLTPEVVDVAIRAPFYARIAALEPETVTFRSFDGHEGSLSRKVAEEHLVRAREVSQAGQTSLLRQSVSMKVADCVHYGQVVAVSEEMVTVRSGEQQYEARRAAVTQVAPVIALILELVEFKTSEWSASDVESVEQTILDRVVGRNGAAGSNDVSVILSGLMEDDCYPAATRICHWIDPATDENTDFELQHAIDYAHFVNGNVTLKPRHVGESFCQPPQFAGHASASNRSVGSTPEVHELFDPFPDDDEMTQEESEQPSNAEIPSETRSHRSKRTLEATGTSEYPQSRKQRPQVALDQDTMIMGKLSDDPELLDRFLQLRREAKSSNRTNEQSDHVPDSSSVTPYTTAAKSASLKKASVTSKYAFIPREEQVAVHDRITAVKHKGKSANVFCKGMVRSEYANFKALPGVCTRTYDIRFGSGGLSIRHFARLSREERMCWLESGGSNFDNLSATAEFAAATPAKHIDDVLDAARVFRTYAREYCCVELVELVDSIVQFIEETLMQVTWATKELSSLVYWVNDVLEDFRDAVEAGGDISSVA